MTERDDKDGDGLASLGSQAEVGVEIVRGEGEGGGGVDRNGVVVDGKGEREDIVIPADEPEVRSRSFSGRLHFLRTTFDGGAATSHIL